MKKAMVLILSIILLMLSGCSGVDEGMQRLILKKSDIQEDPDYQNYERLLAEGRLNQEAEYIDSGSFAGDGSNTAEQRGRVHVTFADNRYLQISYFLDEKMTRKIDTAACYLNPGDIIYASVDKCMNPNSNLYRLAEYRVFEYTETGEIKDRYQSIIPRGNVLYEIPSNFKGTEISVVPVGEYPDRKLLMEVFYIGDDGQKKTLANAGTWSINEADCEGNFAQISPVESYALKFTYDKENYFYVGCEPKCFTKDPAASGFVEFWRADPKDENMSCSVELHRYLSLAVKFAEEAKVSVNQREFETVKKNKTWEYGKLQYGDSIVIETSGKCTVTGGDYQHITAVKDPVEDGFRYTLSVTADTRSNISDFANIDMEVKRKFTVNLDSSCKYGESRYKLDGKTVSGTTQVQEGQVLTVTYKITNGEYRFRKKSASIGGLLQELLNGSEQTRRIPVNADLDGTSINPDDWFEIIKKGE